MRTIHLPLLRLVVLSFALIVFCNKLYAGEYFVETQQDYAKVQDKLVAGDKVVLKNGVWKDFEILFQGQGTKEKPITLTVQEKGKVILSGQSNLRLSGQYLVVSGLVFKDGYTPTSAVIEFRKNAKELAFNSRVTQTVIEDYNNPDKQESDYWLALYGQHNRFDHSYLAAKRNKGVTVAVRLNSQSSQQNYHSIDHNYFGFRPIFGSNGGETLRIGTSHYSLTDSFTRVENNIFERTNGEVEIISVKSGKNTLKGNLFLEARGTLTLRHGNGNIIERNVFLGNGKANTGGIRVINKDQVIRNNYMADLTGYRFGSGFTVLNGVPNSPINRYHQVDNALIQNNSFINVEHMQFAAGSDAERSAVPINSVMKNNLVYQGGDRHPFTIFDDISGIKFSQNLSNVALPDQIKNGFDVNKIKLEQGDNGLLYPKQQTDDIGAPKDLVVLEKDKVGPAWYKKKNYQVAFDSGKTISINADTIEFLNAVNKAQTGDTIELGAGEFIVPKIVVINKPLTIKARARHKTKIMFERTALFEIQDGGSLTIDGLVISGETSPDAHGNSLIRTKKWGMVNNYSFIARNNKFIALDINHSFHFFSTGKGAFADKIVLENNYFNRVSGDILKLDSEIEDLGIYNAEYIVINNNQFNEVRGAVAKIYRGGTDESTFGPQLSFLNNTLSNVGKGKRNKSASSLYLHGAQVSNIAENTFENSALIKIEHTVGEPKTNISDNVFVDTTGPSIKELRVAGPHTAILNNNQFK